MEKFRDLMMKFYSSTTQNKPLSHNIFEKGSQFQINIFEKRLNHILPNLSHTPDHPPYAWMIQKAIEELAEKGNSSKKSISDYIKKEHKDLPWAHETLLNHHLKHLCVSGDIVLTNNQTYVFPVLHSDEKPSKRTTENKHVEKERDWDLLRKKKKKNKEQKAVRKQYMDKKEDIDYLIAEKRPSCDSEGQDVLLNEVPERQDVLNEVQDGQVVLNEVPKGQDVLNEVRDMQIVAEMCSSDAQSNLNQNPKGQQLNAEAHLIAKQRPFCDLGEERSLIEMHEMPDSSLNQEGNKLNDDELKQVQCRLPLEVVSDDDTKNQRGERMLLSSDEAAETLDEYMLALEPITNITKFGLQQIECGELRAMVPQTKPTEFSYQQAIPDLKPTTDEKTCVPQSNPVHSIGADHLRHIVCKFKYQTPGKKAKENLTKRKQSDKCDPQGQKQLDARDSEPIIDANDVRLLLRSGKGLQGQKQLDAQNSEPIDANELQLLSGSAKGLPSEVTTGTRIKLRSGKALIQEGAWKMQKKVHIWKNKSAKHLKPHVVVDMHDDKDSNESIDILSLENSCQPDDGMPVKLECRGRGIPRKFKPESCGSGKLTTSTKKTAEKEVQHLEMELEKPKHKKKSRGRPSKLNKKVVIVNKDNPQIRRGRGRPRKTII